MSNKSRMSWQLQIGSLLRTARYHSIPPLLKARHGVNTRAVNLLDSNVHADCACILEGEVTFFFIDDPDVLPS